MKYIKITPEHYPAYIEDLQAIQEELNQLFEKERAEQSNNNARDLDFIKNVKKDVE